MLFEQACRLMPGGVNSPVRAFRAVGGTPLYISRARGCKIYDADGAEYVDYVASWGAIILGHAHETVNAAIAEAASKGTSYGAPHEGEIKLAQLILKRVPTLERIRFVNSGTEATLSAIRLARAATGRAKILKFEGNYHGASDSLLVKAGSGVATFGLPDSPGVPAAVSADTLVAPYNDAAQVEAILEANRGEVAAILVEPIAGNMGCVPPQPGFLQALRALCTQNGTLLVVDEVMTGFRVAAGGATERFDLSPDLICMGKVIGGGLPVGAYGGRAELMEQVAPQGPVYQAGTLSGNPLAMAAGLAALNEMGPDQYKLLEERGARLEAGLRGVFADANVAAQVQRVGAMLSVFFSTEPIRNFGEAMNSNKAFFGKLFHALLAQGVYLPPSALEAWFITASHSEADIDFTISAFEKALNEVTR